MTIKIETPALGAFLFGILSCKCPISEENEQRLFTKYQQSRGTTEVDFSPFLEISKQNIQRTPIDNLFDFCSYAADDPASFNITGNDVLRYLGSGYHYKMVLAANPDIETTNPGLLFSHILTPVRLSLQGNKPCVLYEDPQCTIQFNSVIIPDELLHTDGFYGHHMGVIISRLTDEQAKMVFDHQALIDGLSAVKKSIKEIDFKKIRPYGNHFDSVVKRFNRNSQHFETTSL
ncbi:hypothetical protein KJ966_07200 [bacterium]|nr:hypothetical protein [bacterium]